MVAGAAGVSRSEHEAKTMLLFPFLIVASQACPECRAPCLQYRDGPAITTVVTDMWRPRGDVPATQGGRGLAVKEVSLSIHNGLEPNRPDDTQPSSRYWHFPCYFPCFRSCGLCYFVRLVSICSWWMGHGRIVGTLVTAVGDEMCLYPADNHLHTKDVPFKACLQNVQNVNPEDVHKTQN